MNGPTNATDPSAAQPAAPPTGADTLVIRRTLAAPPERVFEAWTRPEMVRRWFSPGPMRVEEAALDVRVGDAYRIVMVGAEGEPGEDHTELILTHTGFPDAETRGLHETGWMGCLEKLPPLVGPQGPATAPEAT